MTSFRRSARARHLMTRMGGALSLVTLLVLGGCSTLSPTTTAPPVFYAFDSVPVRAAATHPALASAPVLTVTPTRAAAGFDSQRIIYLRAPHQLAYFAQSEWVEPPARMLVPLLVESLERGPAFRAVVQTGGSASADYRLDTELLRLQHDFQTRPSRVLLELRATLVDDKTRRVLAVRQFSTQVAASTEDAYGGVVAANSAVQQMLGELAGFCADAIATRPLVK